MSYPRSKAETSSGVLRAKPSLKAFFNFAIYSSSSFASMVARISSMLLALAAASTTSW